MSVGFERPDGASACVVRLSGELDMSVVPEVRAVVEGALESGCASIVLDLADVTYADSSALGLLVWLDRMLRPVEGSLVLAGANRNVTRVLELSGLVGFAPCVALAADAGAALARLSSVPERGDAVWEERIDVPALVEHMSRVRARVCELAGPLGLTETSLFDLRVAVGEALANAVRHGSPGGEHDEVAVTVSAFPDRVTVAVQDTGHGFDGASESGVDVYASGGRGVLFMRALMDHVEFTRAEDGGTVVRLTKRLPAGPRPEVDGTVGA
jgi:serine/threonine-protein kinase RsbW